jgi:hypothetical protein
LGVYDPDLSRNWSSEATRLKRRTIGRRSTSGEGVKRVGLAVEDLDGQDAEAAQLMVAAFPLTAT